MCEALLKGLYQCSRNGYHPRHLAYDAEVGEKVSWDNPDCPRPSEKGKVGTKELKTIAESIPKERAASRVAHARTTDPTTSHEAAVRVGDVTQAQKRVLSLLRACGPATDREIRLYAEGVGEKMSPSGLRTRRQELVEQGVIRFTGRYGMSEAGVNAAARIWEVIE